MNWGRWILINTAVIVFLVFDLNSGDELPSQRWPNALLLKRALNGLKDGDIFVAHLGIWSRQDPWAPADLEPLIAGLQQKGFCFATLRQHPAYRSKFTLSSTAIKKP